MAVKSNSNSKSVFYIYEDKKRGIAKHYRLSVAAHRIEQVAGNLRSHGAVFTTYLDSQRKRWIVSFTHMPDALREKLQEVCIVPAGELNYAGNPVLPEYKVPATSCPVKLPSTVKKKTLTREEWEARFEFNGGKVVEKSVEVSA